MIRKGRSIICIILSAAIILGLTTVFAETEPISGDDIVTLAPYASDGVTIYEIDMNVCAELDGSTLTFLETKDLSFTAVFGEGWSYSATYSCFFPNYPDRAEVYFGCEDSVSFAFHAVEGETVALEDFNSVAIFATAAQLPKLEINVDIPFSDIDKSTWVDAEFTLTLGTKQFESGDFSGVGAVKGRGNSSWSQPKKPYSIKLSSKESLLDIPATKKYAIVPGYYDWSLMRNFITYKSGLMLSGIEYTPKCEFVEVYLNGEYNGIYILVERIDLEKTKINIEEATEDDLTGGYLIEKDCAAKIDFSEDQWFDCPYWANQSKDYFVIKTPEPEDEAVLEQMKDYLENHLQKLHDAVMGISDEDYTKYVDIDSWVDFIIMQEIAKNIDGNLKTSCYMYKQSGDDKIYMTALWDFDLAYGMYGGSNAAPGHNDEYDCPVATTADGFMTINSSCPWVQHLYNDYPEFRTALIMRYNEYRYSLIPAMQRMIVEQAAYLRANTDRNDVMWNSSFVHGVNNLRTWLDGRIEWLDAQWLYKKGDVNIDGDISVSDALLTLRSALGLEELTEVQISLADLNGDNTISTVDANLVARMALMIG